MVWAGVPVNSLEGEEDVPRTCSPWGIFFPISKRVRVALEVQRQGTAHWSRGAPGCAGERSGVCCKSAYACVCCENAFAGAFDDRCSWQRRPCGLDFLAAGAIRPECQMGVECGCAWRWRQQAMRLCSVHFVATGAIRPDGSGERVRLAVETAGSAVMQGAFSRCRRDSAAGERSASVSGDGDNLKCRPWAVCFVAHGHCRRDQATAEQAIWVCRIAG